MEYFFKLQRENDQIDINNNYKEYSDIYNKELFREYDELKFKIKNTTNKDIQYLYKEAKKILTYNPIDFYLIFNIDINKSYSINAYYNKTTNNFENYHIRKSSNGDYIDNIENINTKYEIIIANIEDFLYKHESEIRNIKHNCEFEKITYELKLKIIYYLFDYLKKDGIFYMTIHNYCNEDIINLIYILSFMFEYLIIYNGNYICAYNFLDKYSIITKRDFENHLLNNKFNILPKFQFDELYLYFESVYNYKLKLYKLLLDNKEDDFVKEILNFKYNIMNIKNISNKDIISITKQIISSFKRIKLDDKIIKISSSINMTEGNHIKKIIQDNNYKKCLEIGMAFGISAVYILENNETSLISIDPFQKTQWNNGGIELVKSLKLNKRHTLIEKKSYEALPTLLNDNQNFDFIFIDGWHTFDYTLVDFFYSNLLLNINGIIIIDDALHIGVKKSIDYIKSNYSHYKKLDSPTTIGVFKKIGDDDRKWNFHNNF
jgi:predicted O-methyltransferase YrrM